jgi:hypothetical protein
MNDWETFLWSVIEGIGTLCVVALLIAVTSEFITYLVNTL